MRPIILMTAVALTSAGCSGPAVKPDNAQLVEQVRETERAFAHTMAARDPVGFASFLSSEAVFVSGTETITGAEQVAAAWKPYFTGPQAPFSWQPERVDVLASGTLASSSGPVFGPDGKTILRFHSIWRLEAPGTWRIVFDHGSAICAPVDAGSAAK